VRSGDVRHPERSAAGKPLDGGRDMLVSGNPVKLARLRGEGVIG
jgi:hypothetical protein